MKTRIYK